MSTTRGTPQHPCCHGCIIEYGWLDDMPDHRRKGLTGDLSRQEYEYLGRRVYGGLPTSKIPPEILQGLQDKGYMKYHGKGRGRGWRCTLRVRRSFNGFGFIR